ncbi:MAG TPA: hypothetical protein EYP98_00650 [Planctomycetes bacterium]|nr:hypothetical protein [Planctomycetota bacterium]
MPSREAVATVVVVALQVMHPNGATAATRMRIGVSTLAVLLVWPACSYGPAIGAFTALCLTKLLFLVLAVSAMQKVREMTPAEVT